MGDEFKMLRELAEEVAALRLPSPTDQRLQHLMDRNNDGMLSPSERQELESLAAMSETISILRANAIRVLGWKPAGSHHFVAPP